ncbi:hypothetical protein Mal4_00690 [Maioricimonas rarisocia]|uniref:Uncharacterized protein n=1 Tax=Maioricimonas rarisocia TaxID=2528026 RepID=A0A517YZY2_9PLAN|nr:hypothetical protein Mal4_00690 [Maioricimonas rarisocia]
MEEVADSGNFAVSDVTCKSCGAQEKRPRHEWRRRLRGSVLRRASHKSNPIVFRPPFPCRDPGAESFRQWTKSVRRKRSPTGGNGTRCFTRPCPQAGALEWLDTAAGQSQMSNHILLIEVLLDRCARRAQLNSGKNTALNSKRPRHEWRRRLRGSALRRASHKSNPHHLQVSIPAKRSRREFLPHLDNVHLLGRDRQHTGTGTDVWCAQPFGEGRLRFGNAADRPQVPKHGLTSGRNRHGDSTTPPPRRTEASEGVSFAAGQSQNQPPPSPGHDPDFRLLRCSPYQRARLELDRDMTHSVRRAPARRRGRWSDPTLRRARRKCRTTSFPAATP